MMKFLKVLSTRSTDRPGGLIDTEMQINPDKVLHYVDHGLTGKVTFTNGDVVTVVNKSSKDLMNFLAGKKGAAASGEPKP